MAIKWHSEPWRKLYTRISGTWLQLPVSARGLGTELLKYADDVGFIVDAGAEDPGLTIAYMLGAKPREHKRIVDDVSALLDDGYLVLEGTRLKIRNFSPAQERLSPNAVKQKRYRDRVNGNALRNTLPDGEVTRYVTPDVTSDAGGSVTVTGKRNETKRSPSSPPSEDPDNGRSRFFERWCYRANAPMADPTSVGLCFDLVVGYAEKTDKSVKDVGEEALDAYGRYVGTWKKPIWTPQLFVKHWEAVQGEMFKPSRGNGGPTVYQPGYGDE